MGIDRRLFGWGVFFILLGAVPIAVRANAVDPNLVGRWPTLWPVLLIGWGLGLLLRRTPISWLGGTLSAVTFGLMGGGLIATGFSGVPIGVSCGGAGGQPFQAQQGTFASTGQLDVEFDCGTLHMASSDGSGWSVSGTDRNAEGPAVDQSPSGHVTIHPRDAGFLVPGGRSTWTVNVPRSPHLELGVTLNAGDGNVDLTGASVDAFDATVNAGSLTADLSKAGTLARDGLDTTVNAGKATISLPAFDGSMSLSLNAGSLQVCLAAATPVVVHWSGTLASNDLDQSGLTRTGDNTWATPGLDPNAAHVELDVSANAGSFELQQGGTCGA